jgi:MbtH protein
MNNPFEEPDGRYLVLVNDEHPHSLWPARITVPAGRPMVPAQTDRQTCLDSIDEHRTDVRPRSLAEAMDDRET